MRSQGQVVKWFDEKGYGFVAAQASGAEVFLHVRDLPRTGRRPTVGDRIQFDVESDDQGRKRAVRVTWEDPLPGGAPTPRAAAAPRPTSPRPASPRRETHRPRRPRRERRTGLVGTVIGAVMLVMLAVLAWERFAPVPANTPGALAAAPNASALAPGEAFRCDDRQHCSQMRSCAEAQYFARNCPGTKMDGDRDGHACEDRCP